MRGRTFRLLAVTAVLMLVVAACAGDDTADSDTTTTTAGSTDTTAAETTTTAGATTTEAMADTDPLTGLPVIDPFDVPAGDVAMAGSSTVFPLSTEILTLWEDEGGPGYSLDSIGSGGGFERFCVDGASDISNASRPINDEEVAACESIGRTPIEIRVGTDALSLVISKGNTFATELTFEEIALAFSLTDAGATWADVNPDFPPHPIALYSPGQDSGTFDYFNEEIFPDVEVSPILSSIASIVGEDDNVTVQGVAEDGCTEGDTSTTCALGYFGYAYFQENAARLQAAFVEGVEPGDDSVNEGTYPLARPLFIYTAASIIDEKPQVADFVAFYLNNVKAVIGNVGYFPAPDEAIKEAAAKIAEAAGW